jgi:hypothetical protein
MSSTSKDLEKGWMPNKYRSRLALIIAERGRIVVSLEDLLVNNDGSLVTICYRQD